MKFLADVVRVGLPAAAAGVLIMVIVQVTFPPLAADSVLWNAVGVAIMVIGGAFLLFGMLYPLWMLLVWRPYSQ